MCALQRRWHRSWQHCSGVTWLIHMWRDFCICDMTHSFMYDVTFLCVTWLSRIWHVCPSATLTSLMATLLTCDMTHSCGTWLFYMWHDLFICDMCALQRRRRRSWQHCSRVTWLIHMWRDFLICGMTQSYMTCVPFSDADVAPSNTAHARHDSFMRDMTNSYVAWLVHVRHDSLICGMTHSYVAWLIHMWLDLFTRDMTWY